MTFRTLYGSILALFLVVPTARPAFYDNSLTFAATVAGTVIVSKFAYDAISLIDTHQLPELYKKLFIRQQVPTLAPEIKVGLLKICGDIWEIENTHDYLAKIEECAMNDSIQALFVYINSHGGRPGLSELIFRELCNLRMKKPVITVIDNACFSGGYLVACAADHIIATSAAEVGSVGARMTVKHFAELPEETIGQEKGKTETEIITAGKFKATGCNFYVKLTEEERTYLQEVINKQYDIFCRIVADARGLSLDERAIWADGKFFVAEDALKLGLIDSCGSWTDAQKIILDLIKQKNPNAQGPLKIVAI